MPRRTALSDHAEPSQYILLHCVYNLNDRDTRAKVMVTHLLVHGATVHTVACHLGNEDARAVVSLGICSIICVAVPANGAKET